jgi:glycosyltransferase involved in cell wall biosynthesis
MRILEITSYPPPRSGWSMRVELLKRHLEAHGHECVVLNIGQSRRTPSPDYETVLSGFDYIKKLWRYSARGYLAHVHVNGASPKGFVLALIAEFINLICGKRCVLTFHAGTDQIYFPRPKYPSLFPLFWVLFTIPRRIICNSEPVKRKIQEYGISGRKISAIQAFTRQYLEFEPRRLDDVVEIFYSTFPVVVFSYLNLRPKFHPLELLDGFARVARRRPDCGLVLCGLGGYVESDLGDAVQQRLHQSDLVGRVYVIDNLNHDEFLTALSRASVFLRSHTSDGVCSSVLEALSLRVPVLAAENGQRPPGVLTYNATDAGDLATVLEDLIARRGEVAAAMPVPDLPDTLTSEGALLVGEVDSPKPDPDICAV